jgi:hypothetical protein
MAEKINFIDLRRDQFAETLFLRSIVMWQDAAGEKIPHTPGKDMDVRLTVNGVDVPFVAAMKTLRGSLHSIAKEYAEEMIRDRLRPLDDRIERIQRRLEALIEEELGRFPEAVGDE